MQPSFLDSAYMLHTHLLELVQELVGYFELVDMSLGMLDNLPLCCKIVRKLTVELSFSHARMKVPLPSSCRCISMQKPQAAFDRLNETTEENQTAAAQDIKPTSHKKGTKQNVLATPVLGAQQTNGSMVAGRLT